MHATPITALIKALRDGREFRLELVPDPEASKWAYWMRASIDGKPVYKQFRAAVERNAVTGLGDLKHAIGIRVNGKRVPVGLTDAEADQIDAALKEWTARYERAALAAAPDAPTWEISGVPWRLRPGMTIEGGNGRVMILRQVGRWWTEDGRSFHLDAEEGWLYSYTVRALTAEEEREETGR